MTAFETVTGYCWPQSAVAGERVALHLSSAGVGRCRSRWLGSAPNEPLQIDFIASLLFDHRDPASVERIAHGDAVPGSIVSAVGGTVITSGCTDRVWGLAERDPHVEQITRNMLDRLA